MTVRRARRRTPTGLIRSLPIGAKIAFSLLGILLVSSLATDFLTRQILLSSQRDIVGLQMESISRAQGFRVVDSVGEALVTLNRLALEDPIQSRLLFATFENPVGDVAPLDVTLVQFLNQFIGINSEYRVIGLFDSSDRLVSVTPRAAAQQLSTPADIPWYATVAQQEPGALHITTVDRDGEARVEIAFPIHTANGSYLGVLYAEWNLLNISAFLDEGTQWETLVVNRSGVVLVAPPGVEDAPLGRDVVAEMQQQSGVFMVGEDSSGRFIYGYTDLAQLGTSPRNPATRLDWIVVARQPEAIIASSVAEATNQLRLALLATVVVATVVVFLAAQLITRPLSRLIDTVAQVERGDLNVVFPTVSGDELGRLTVAFQSLVTRLSARLRQLNAAVQVSRATALTLDISQSLDRVVSSIQEQFGYPDVRIYLLEQGGRSMWVQAARGEEAIRLQRSGTRIRVDEASTVGRAVLLGEAQVGGDLEAAAFIGHDARPAELAIPLTATGRSLGALLLISDRPGAFDREDIDLLRLVGDQIGALVQNSRLLDQSRTNLAEIEALNRRLTRQAWEEYVSDVENLRHTLDPEQRWPELRASMEALQDVKAEIYSDADGRSVLAAPLILRGQIVGSLAVSRAAGDHWTADEVTLIESVAQRVVMIAEGIRLVEQSSLRAERERRVNEVSTELLQRAASVDNVLQAALSQLSGALGSDHVSLRIGPPPLEPGHQIRSGGSDSVQSSNGADGTDAQAPAHRLPASPDSPEPGEGDMKDVS